MHSHENLQEYFFIVYGETSGIHQKILILNEYYNHELRWGLKTLGYITERNANVKKVKVSQ